MDAFDLVFQARRVITPEGEAPRRVGVRDGRIAAVEPLTGADDWPADRVIELADDEVLLPGLVDAHVHVNDPGRAEWEGFASATRAAAAGGVTTIVDMPLNSVPPTVDLAGLAAKRAAATGRVHVDVGFWGGLVPGNTADLPALHAAGVFGFKCFLLHSGVAEFAPVTPAHLVNGLRVLAELDALTIVHAEDAHTIEQAVPAAGGRSSEYARFLASRPAQAEHTAIAAVVAAAAETGARAHILHLSSADALPMIAAARRDGVRLTVETCPHYLSFVAEEIPDGATQFKCCPPIRDAANRERLWRGLVDGVIDYVASDHSPCPAELKRLDLGDFDLAWGGVAGLQLGLPAVWTQARQRGVPLADVVGWLADRPAQVVGVAGKGRIALGCDADFCVFAPDDAFVVDAARLHHRHPITPYHGRPLAGVVRETWLRGREVTGDVPRGRLLTRSPQPQEAR